MKKINRNLFLLISILIGAFMMSNNSVNALEDVVFNPNSSGEGTYIYDEVQYTSARDIDVAINIEEETLSKYDTMFDICENIPASAINNTRPEVKCSSYLTQQGVNRFQISGRGDGEKEISIYFYNDYSDKNSVVKAIEKTIVLDTSGPIIELTGGEYIYLLQSEEYVDLGATCTDDSGVVGETCVVTVGEINIDKNKSGFQYIRYTATDFLGNEVNVTRKIVVEMPEEKKDYTYWIIAGVGIAILSGFLFIKVLKNKDKRKNQSIL